MKEKLKSFKKKNKTNNWIVYNLKKMKEKLKSLKKKPKTNNWIVYNLKKMKEKLKSLKKKPKNDNLIVYNLKNINIEYEKFIPVLIQTINSITRYNFSVKFFLISDKLDKLEYLLNKYKSYLLENNIIYSNDLNQISNNYNFIELDPTLLWYEDPFLLLFNNNNHDLQNIDNKFYYKINLYDDYVLKKYNCINYLFPPAKQISNKYTDLVYNKLIPVNAVKSKFSFTLLLTTIGNDELINMLKSLTNQLDLNDNLFICVDGIEYGNKFYNIFNKIKDQFKCNIIIKIHYKNLGFWGHGLRNLYQSKLPGDFIWNIDDDDIILPNAVNIIKEFCINKKYIYFFPIMYNFKKILKFRIQQDNIGTPSAIIPNIKSHFGKWEYAYGGDFDFYWNTIKYIGIKNIRSYDKPIYNINTKTKKIIMVMFCVNNTDYVNLGIKNINSLHNINSNRECHIYTDKICYNYYQKNKHKFNFPEKVKIIHYWDKINFKWQWCYQYLLKDLKYDFFICDADTIWNIDPFISIENKPNQFFFLQQDSNIPCFKNIKDIISLVPFFFKNIYNDFNLKNEDILNLKILWNGVLYIPLKFRSELFINYLFKYTQILEEGLPDNILKSSRMFEQNAQALICQIFYPWNIFIIQNSKNNNHIINLCYGSEGKISNWYNLNERNKNLINRQQKLLNKEYKLTKSGNTEPTKVCYIKCNAIINKKINYINKISVEDLINFTFVNQTLIKNTRIIESIKIKDYVPTNNSDNIKYLSNINRLNKIENILKYNDLIKVSKKEKNDFLTKYNNINKLEILTKDTFSIFLISNNVKNKQIKDIIKFKNTNNLKLNIKFRTKKIFINCKLQDLLLLNGALNFLAEYYNTIIVLINKNKVYNQLVFHSNINFEEEGNNYNLNEYDSIDLRSDEEYKLNYSRNINIGIDEYKYYLLGFDIEIKWKYFKYNKPDYNLSEKDKYIFVEKKELYTSSNTKIIIPSDNTNIFNYMSILENAEEVHLIDGPFLELIDLTNICNSNKVFVYGKIKSSLNNKYNYISHTSNDNTIGLIIPFYHCYNENRYNVCDKIFHHYSIIRKSLKKINIDLIVLCIGSENELSKKIARKYNHIYLEFDQHNTDLVTNRKLINVKYNIGYKYLSSYNCQYYMSVGSDDLFTEGIFKSIINGKYFDLGFPGKFLKHCNDGGWNMIDISNYRSVKILKYLLDKDDVDYCLSNRKDIFDKPKGTIQNRNKLSLDSIGGCVIVSDKYTRELNYEPHTMANESLTFMHAYKKKKKIKLFRMKKDQYEYWNIKTEVVSNTFDNIIKYFDYDKIDNKDFLEYYHSL
jgi:hypothetical protein